MLPGSGFDPRDEDLSRLHKPRNSLPASEQLLRKSLSKEEEEIFKTATVGAKRRIADRRMRKRSRGYSPVRSRKTYNKSGRITFTTHYISDSQLLEVHLLRAYDLAPNKNTAEINPFVRLYLCPGKKQKQNTKYQKCTKEPFINEKILFFDLPKLDLIKHKLQLQVYSHSKVKKNELLGQVDIALGSLDVDVKETFNSDLFLERTQVNIYIYYLVNKQIPFCFH